MPIKEKRVENMKGTILYDANFGSLKVFVLEKAKQPVGCALQLYIIDVTSKAVDIHVETKFSGGVGSNSSRQI